MPRVCAVTWCVAGVKTVKGEVVSGYCAVHAQDPGYFPQGLKAAAKDGYDWRREAAKAAGKRARESGIGGSKQ